MFGFGKREDVASLTRRIAALEGKLDATIENLNSLERFARRLELLQLVTDDAYGVLRRRLDGIEQKGKGCSSGCSRRMGNVHASDMHADG